MNEIQNAYNEITNVPSDVFGYDKFEAICVLLENESPEKIADFINGGNDGWGNAEEHNDWLGNASAGEIASWVKSGIA